jgi:hypothetical protein
MALRNKQQVLHNRTIVPKLVWELVSYHLHSGGIDKDLAVFSVTERTLRGVVGRKVVRGRLAVSERNLSGPKHRYLV